MSRGLKRRAQARCVGCRLGDASQEASSRLLGGRRARYCWAEAGVMPRGWTQREPRMGGWCRLGAEVEYAENCGQREEGITPLLQWQSISWAEARRDEAGCG